MLDKKHFSQTDDVSLEDSSEETIEQRIEALTELDSVDADGFNVVNWNIALDHCIEEDKDGDLKDLHGLLSSDQAAALEKIVSQGPVDDGDIESKKARDEIAELGLVVRIASEGSLGPWAANDKGFHLWRAAGGDTGKDDG